LFKYLTVNSIFSVIV